MCKTFRFRFLCVPFILPLYEYREKKRKEETREPQQMQQNVVQISDYKFKGFQGKFRHKLCIYIQAKQSSGYSQ
jgi:hypothetical protein